MMGQLAEQDSGFTNPAGGCPIVTVHSICFLNITVFVMYMCTWFGFCVLCFVVFWVGASLLEIGLHRLAPPLLKCSVFVWCHMAHWVSLAGEAGQTAHRFV